MRTAESHPPPTLMQLIKSVSDKWTELIKQEAWWRPFHRTLTVLCVKLLYKEIHILVAAVCMYVCPRASAALPDPFLWPEDTSTLARA